MSRKAFECKIGEYGEWWVMNVEELSADNAAKRFARMMIEQEWRMYDLRLAEKMAKEPIYVRYGEEGEIKEYKVSKTRLALEVEVEYA